MPVKNVKRKTNDGFEGVITGLNDKEKEIISKSVDIEANPADEATETLEKLKVGNTTYGVEKGGIKLNKNISNLISEEDGAKIFSIDLTDEEKTDIREGKVECIYGEIDSDRYFAIFSGADNDTIYFNGSNIVTIGNPSEIGYIIIGISNDLAMANYFIFTQLPSLPADASAKTYALKAVNGTLTWVE